MDTSKTHYQFIDKLKSRLDKGKMNELGGTSEKKSSNVIAQRDVGIRNSNRIVMS